MNAHQGDSCQLCGKDAIFMCSQCKWTVYCSKQHQLQHWRIHKEQCAILNSYRLRAQESEINKIRADLRKKYFQNFMHKIYDSCIKLAQQLVSMEFNHIRNTRQVFNELQYGISVCLLARSWINVKCESKAVVVINNYIQQKMHFLKDMRDIVNFESTARKQLTKPQQDNNPIANHNQTEQNTKIHTDLHSAHSIIRQFAIQKVSLIASVANILYAIKHPVIKMYDIYTQHIEKMFGKESFEASNCYFMVGSHYMENHQYYKSIACFIRASEIRGNMAGDCYYNLGILFHLLKNPKLALMMFQNSAKLRQNQFSENSSQVADVYHNIALIHQGMGNYKGSIQNLEKIALIYSKDKNSPEYKNAKESIKALQAAFRKHVEKTNQAGLGAGLNDIKKTIRKGGKAQDDALSQNSFQAQKEMMDRDKKFGQTNYLKLSDNFIGKLNPLQSFHLSELQIQLSRCQTIYMAASTLGSSHFLKVIKLTKLEELIRENQNLFKHVSIQKLSKRGIKDINMILG